MMTWVASIALCVPPVLPPRTPLTGSKVKRTSTVLDKVGERKPHSIPRDDFHKVINLSKISKATKEMPSILGSSVHGTSVNTSSSIEFTVTGETSSNLGS